MIIYLYINNQNVTPFVDWTTTELVVERNDAELTMSIEIKDVKLVENAYQIIAATFPDTYLVKIVVGSLVFTGEIYPGNVRMASDYCICDIDIGAANAFARAVEGRLLDEQDFQKCEYLVASRTNAQAILTLSVSTFIMTYLLIKEIYELGKDIAIITGIAASGVTGPPAALATQIAITALRVIYIAALIVAIVNLVQELSNYLEVRKTTRAIRLSTALSKYCQMGGYVLGSYPSWFDKVYLVGGDITDYEASEVFLLARQLSNSIIYVYGNQVRFVQASQSIDSQYRRAYEEYYYYNYNEIPRREVVSLIRDTADEHALDEPAAVEIVRDSKHRGYMRVDIAAATARVAQDRPLLLYLQELNSALAALYNLLNSGNASASAASDRIIIAEREIFTRKIVYSQSLSNIDINHTRKLLEIVRDQYVTNRICKVYENIRIPFTFADLQNLQQQAFAGVRSLRWHIHDEYAVVTYQQVINISNVVNVKII